jgi:hypothetical protein
MYSTLCDLIIVINISNNYNYSVSRQILYLSIYFFLRVFDDFFLWYVFLRSFPRVFLRVFLPPFLELLPLDADLALILMIGLLKSILGINILLPDVAALCFILNENPEGFIVFVEEVLIRLLIIL